MERLVKTLKEKSLEEKKIGTMVISKLLDELTIETVPLSGTYAFEIRGSQTFYFNA